MIIINLRLFRSVLTFSVALALLTAKGASKRPFPEILELAFLALERKRKLHLYCVKRNTHTERERLWREEIEFLPFFSLLVELKP